MALQQLNAGAVSSSAQIPFYDPANGGDRRVSLAAMAEALRPLLAPLTNIATVYAAPNASGFTVTIAPPVQGQSLFLALTPAAGYAAGTIALPAKALLVDGQEVTVATSQAVTALTVNASGVPVYGAPTTLAAGGFFRLRYEGALGVWFRVG